MKIRAYMISSIILLFGSHCFGAPPEEESGFRNADREQHPGGTPAEPEREGITLKKLFLYGTAQDAEKALVYYTALKRENSTIKSKTLELMTKHLEVQFIHFIIKLDFLVKKYPGEDSAGAKKVLNRIILGVREGYIDLDPYIKTEKCTIILGELIDVPLRAVYESVEIPKKEATQELKWFEKYGVK
jgi:hypothetical protein